MRSQLKSSPTRKEKLRKHGAAINPEVMQPDEMEELNGVIDQMVGVAGSLIRDSDKPPSVATIGSVYKIDYEACG